MHVENVHTHRIGSTGTLTPISLTGLWYGGQLVSRMSQLMQSDVCAVHVEATIYDSNISIYTLIVFIITNEH